MSRHHCIAVLLVVITVAVFWQVHDHEFVWDDDVNVYENPHLNPGPSPDILRFWQKPYKGLYIPLTYTVWATLARFTRTPTTAEGTNLDPRLFHVANLVVHLLSMIVVFTILRILVRDDWAACGGALLFALHPVQVEPVAWVTGMKDVLSGFFSLVALWQYLAYASTRPTYTKGETEKRAETWVEEKGTPNLKWWSFHYALATLAFILALLSKPSAVVVPVVAWVLDFWVLRRSVRQSTVALIGWIALAVPFIVLTKLVQSDSGLDFVTPLWARPLVASDAVAFYIYSLALPLWLGPDYGRTPELVLRQGWIYLTWIVPFSLAVLIWLWRDQRPWLVASVGIFVIGILPVSGLVPFVFQRISTVADRYLYISMLGPALALASFLSQRKRLLPVAVVCLLILGFLGIKSAFQTQYWQNNFTLFNHALRLNPNSWLGHSNLGVWLVGRGKLEEAIQHYHEVIRIAPEYADAHYDLGNALNRQGMVDEAIQRYHEAILIDPNLVDAHYNLGNALRSQNKVEEAIQHYHEAIRIDPNFVGGHVNLGNVLRSRGQLEEAIGHYRQALRINPAHSLAHSNLGIALAEQGSIDEAIDHFIEALQIDPTNALIYANLGTAVASRGELEKAIEYYRRAVQVKPEYADAHERLGRLLTQLGRRDEAIQHLEEALRIMKSGNASSVHMMEKRVVQ